MLRRVIEDVKTQNWFAVVLEFLIVVLSIFFALQANNWNEARKDRIDERRLISRLHVDVTWRRELTHLYTKNQSLTRRVGADTGSNVHADLQCGALTGVRSGIYFGLNDGTTLDQARRTTLVSYASRQTRPVQKTIDHRQEVHSALNSFWSQDHSSTWLARYACRASG